MDTHETKLPTYWNTPFNKICLGMKVCQEFKSVVINHQARSLYSLIADGKYRATSLGRNTWKKLIGSRASLHPTVTRTDSTFYAPIATTPKRELVLSQTIKMSVAVATPESGLALEGFLMTTTRLSTKLQNDGIYLGSTSAVICRETTFKPPSKMAEATPKCN